MTQILYLTGQSVTVYCTHRKGAQALARFACNEDGYAELVQWLNSIEPQPLAILADLIEEEFREEILPHTLGRDRSNLHARQAGKLFRTTPFRYRRIVGRQPDGRRDDRVLFSALTNRDNIEPLLEALIEVGIPVKGIYSLPIITRRLLKPLAIKADNVLIITEQPDGGLRETFLHKGQVYFSRLAPISDGSPADYCRIVKTEASKTRRYLISLKLLPPTEQLNIYTLGDSARMEALQDMFADDSDLHIHSVSLSRAAKLLGFAGHCDERFSAALFCYLLQTRLTGNHYALPSHLCHWQTHKTRLGLRMATWLLAVGAATLSGTHIIDGLLVEQETGQVNRVAAQVNRNYQQAALALPMNPDEAVAMREALQIADRLNAYPVQLESLFSLLGNGFSQQPHLAMDEFGWFVGSSLDAQAPSEVRDTGRPVTVTESPYLISKVSGHVRRFSGNYRRAHDQVEHLARWLSAQPGVASAEVVSHPLDTRVDSELQGGIAITGNKETAKFELRIVMELAYEPV